MTKQEVIAEIKQLVDRIKPYVDYIEVSITRGQQMGFVRREGTEKINFTIEFPDGESVTKRGNSEVTGIAAQDTGDLIEDEYAE